MLQEGVVNEDVKRVLLDASPTISSAGASRIALVTAEECGYAIGYGGEVGAEERHGVED